MPVWVLALHVLLVAADVPGFEDESPSFNVCTDGETRGALEKTVDGVKQWLKSVSAPPPTPHERLHAQAESARLTRTMEGHARQAGVELAGAVK